jgi:polyribonucleotide nucleotidyltransferase
MSQTINPFGKKIISVEKEFCGRKLTLEVGRVGFRSTSAVIARYGDTVILATAMVSEQAVAGMDYFPLSIDYEEKMYAAGKISGSRFVKREGRPSDDAVLIGRLIDRPIRPLWPKGYRNEVQGVTTVLSLDPNFRADSIAMIAMSAAFMLTGAPFGPVASVRVGLVDGKLQAFVSRDELEKGKLDLVVAGTEKAIMMVEAGAAGVSEEQIIEALQFAHESIQPAIQLQKELIEQVGVQPQQYELSLPSAEVQKKVDQWLKGKLGVAIRTDYPDRHEKMHLIREELLKHFKTELGEEEFASVRRDYEEAFAAAANKDVREGVLQDNIRPDGRSLTDIRPLSSEVGILPRAHGSSLFTRGMTQAMNIVTLAPLSYSQVIDTMEKSGEKRYMHHYNAPGYTTGDIRRLGSPGRREIGHSALAERALISVLPDENSFPYAIRSVTEIMSQHGSTSMAATCSSCLALMDAGVPITAPVSGIAMGLILDGDKAAILTDIADAEDFAGDMDFKVAGTEEGITALQMDMKVHGLNIELLKQALRQAKEGRAFILKSMLSTLAAPRAELSPYAPRVETIQINPEKIRDVIGKGGENINRIIADTGVEIDIKDDGIIYISSPDKQSIEAAINQIRVMSAEPEVGKIYENCRVVSVLDFGAFVEILPGKEGLVHVSEMAEERIASPSSVVKEGDKVTVKLIAIDDRGRLQLSMKAAARQLKDMKDKKGYGEEQGSAK